MVLTGLLALFLLDLLSTGFNYVLAVLDGGVSMVFSPLGVLHNGSCLGMLSL